MREPQALTREYDRARGDTDALSHDLAPDKVMRRPYENSGAVSRNRIGDVRTEHLGHALPTDRDPDQARRIDGCHVLHHRA
ncbi:hypothetical protein ACFY93_06565 [Streptomyces sp. NPDC008313]|uniref:hypothetical protein n=1 Tax=Streptomyces sp. NPDC008313 TaxID=3364826 RepID=UPI0036EF4E30